MKKTISFLLLTLLLTPSFVYGASRLASECSSQSTANPPTTTGTPQSTGNKPLTGSLSDPIGVPSLACLFYKIVDLVMSFSYAVIAFFLLYSGFKFVTAQGSQDKLTDAKRTFWYTIIGSMILVGAYTIIEVVYNLILKLQA